MKTIEAVVVILIVALGASLIFNYSLYASNQQLKSAFNSLNETELVFTQSTSTTDKSLGLNFNMAINTTLLQSGEAISITLNETNTFPYFNNITASENWSYSGFEGQLGGGINLLNRPFTVAIVGGYYTASEIEGTNSLPIFSSPAIIYLLNYACLGGNCIPIPPTEYDFYPSSSLMIINYNQSWGLPPLNESASSSMSFSGYYDNSSWNVIHEFTPGVYTVIGGDEWGQLVLLHFVVV
jgi:type II secretory pathway pseudopilin PulG